MIHNKAVFRIVAGVAAGCIVLAICILIGLRVKSMKGADTGHTAEGSIVSALGSTQEQEFSDEINKTITERWEEWNSKDAMTKALSSTTPGFFAKSFENWDEAVAFTGFEPWNPFEKASWAEKMNYTGADIKTGDILEHCCFEGNGNRKGELELGTLTAGYAFDGVRISYRMILAGDFHIGASEADAETSTLDIILPAAKDSDTSATQTAACRVIRRHTDSYDGLELAFLKDESMVYSVLLTSFDGIEKLENAYARVAECLGFDVAYDRLFGQNSSSDLSITYLPEQTPETDAIPGTDALEVPGTD